MRMYRITILSKTEPRVTYRLERESTASFNFFGRLGLFNLDSRDPDFLANTLFEGSWRYDRIKGKRRSKAILYGIADRFESNLHIDGIRRRVAQICIERAEVATTFQYIPAGAGYTGCGIAVSPELRWCVNKGN